MEEKTSELKELRRVTQKVQVEEQKLGDESVEGPSYTSKIRECSHVVLGPHGFGQSEAFSSRFKDRNYTGESYFFSFPPLFCLHKYLFHKC